MPRFRGARLLALAAVCCSALAPAPALDEIVLTNGRRYQGKIIADTPQSIVLSIDGGTVELPRTAVASPPYHGPLGAEPLASPAQTEEPAGPPHPLPGVARTLGLMRESDWGRELRQLPALVTDRGRWRQIPRLSFWAGGFFQVNFHGDPARPAAIELSLPATPGASWEQKRALLEFMFALVPGLAVDSRFDRLNLEGDSFAVDDLWFVLSGPGSADTPGRWTLLLTHEPSLAPARANEADLQAITEPVSAAMIDPSRPRSWQRGSWTRGDLSWLRDTTLPPPGDAQAAEPAAVDWPSLENERIFARAFARQGDRFVRTNASWLGDAVEPP